MDSIKSVNLTQDRLPPTDEESEILNERVCQFFQDIYKSTSDVNHQSNRLQNLSVSFTTFEQILDFINNHFQNVSDKDGLATLLQLCRVLNILSQNSLVFLRFFQLLKIQKLESKLKSNTDQSDDRLKEVYAQIEVAKLTTQLETIKCGVLGLKTLFTYVNFSFFDLPIVNQVKSVVQMVLCLFTYQYLAYLKPSLYNQLQRIKPAVVFISEPNPHVSKKKNEIFTLFETTKKDEELFLKIGSAESLYEVKQLLSERNLTVPSHVKSYSDWKLIFEEYPFKISLMSALRSEPTQNAYTPQQLGYKVKAMVAENFVRATTGTSNKKEETIAHLVRSFLANKLLPNKINMEINCAKVEQLESIFMSLVYLLQTILPILVGTAVLETLIGFLIGEFVFIGAPLLLTVLAIPSIAGAAIFILILFLKMRYKPAEYSLGAVSIKIRKNLNQVEYFFDLSINFVSRLIISVMSELTNRTGKNIFLYDSSSLNSSYKQLVEDSTRIANSHQNKQKSFEAQLRKYYLSDLKTNSQEIRTIEMAFLELNPRHFSKEFEEFLSRNFRVAIKKHNTQGELEYENIKVIWDAIKRHAFESQSYSWMNDCYGLDAGCAINPFMAPR